MYSRLFQIFCCAGMLGLTTTPANAGETDGYQVVDNIMIYIGLMPAAIISGHASDHTEKVMHGGIPQGKHRSHLVVAAFDASTYDRITQADVVAILTDQRGAEQRIQLDAMTIEDSVTFGGYLHLPDDGGYQIRIELTQPELNKTVEAEFQHDHAG